MRMSVDTLFGMFRRMTSRERRLTGILAAAVGMILVVGTCAGTQAIFSGIEEEIDYNAKVLSEMKELAPRYAELSDAKRQIEEAIRTNKAASVRVAANEILKKLTLSSEVPGATGTLLSDIVSFEGKTIETPVEVGKLAATSKKKPKGKGKDDAAGSLIEVEQPLEFKEVPVKDLFAFLDMIESSKDLLFVTRMELARKFNNMAHVRATVSMATFQFKSEGATATE